jgi:hypothetical protein
MLAGMPLVRHGSLQIPSYLHAHPRFFKSSFSPPFWTTSSSCSDLWTHWRLGHTRLTAVLSALILDAFQIIFLGQDTSPLAHGAATPRIDFAILYLKTTTRAHSLANQCSFNSLGLTIVNSRSTTKRLAA